MVIDERSRHDLFTRLEEVLGREQAGTLMEHLPPSGWADVAAKQDLEHLRVATKQDIEHLRVDIEHLRVATKQDLEHLEARMDSRFESVDSRFDALNSRFEALENRFEARLHDELRSQLRTMVQWLIFATTTSTFTVGALAFAAARLA